MIFCSFWSMSVNIIDKVQFLSFRETSPCEIVFKSGLSKAEILQYFNFSNGRNAIFYFFKSPFFGYGVQRIGLGLLAIGVQRVEMHQHVKFWQNRLISYEDIKIFQFLPHDAMLSAVYALVCVCLSVCLSVCVCVSVTLRYCIKTAKRRITQITPHNNPGTLVFWHQSSRRNSNGITSYGGDKCRWGGIKYVTFDEKRAITGKRYKIQA